MGRSVRIPPRVGRMIESVLIDANKQALAHHDAAEALREFQALLHPPRIPKSKPKSVAQEENRDETADLWKRAMARSGGVCECGCGRHFHEEGENKPEMDHEASRRVPQTIQNVWMLTLACHRLRQQNRPSELYWLRVFLHHCQKHDYLSEVRRVEDRTAVAEAKSALPAAPRGGNHEP